MFGSLTKIPVRQLKILILNPLSLLVYDKNMSAYYTGTCHTFFIKVNIGLLFSILRVCDKFLWLITCI